MRKAPSDIKLWIGKKEPIVSGSGTPKTIEGKTPKTENTPILIKTDWTEVISAKNWAKVLICTPGRIDEINPSKRPMIKSQNISNIF